MFFQKNYVYSLQISILNTIDYVHYISYKIDEHKAIQTSVTQNPHQCEIPQCSSVCIVLVSHLTFTCPEYPRLLNNDSNNIC